jgi:hypothetical protein
MAANWLLYDSTKVVSDAFAWDNLEIEKLNSTILDLASLGISKETRIAFPREAGSGAS